MFLKRLIEPLNIALEEVGYEEPTEVQKNAITKIKSGADLLCLANEGTGRTTAIVIGVIHKLKAAFEDVPRALIVVPDEEHAIAMKEQFDILGKHTDLRVFPAFEKQDINKLRDNIYFGSDVVIGSAKRLNELYSYNGLNLNNLKMLIVDDADVLLRHEVMAQMDRLGDCVPKCQHIVFTKKLNDRIERFAEVYMNIFDIMDLS